MRLSETSEEPEEDVHELSLVEMSKLLLQGN